MRFVRPDGIKPSLQGFRSATANSDGTVDATRGDDIAKLLAAGFVQLATMPTTGDYDGVTSFDRKVHSGLIVPVLQGTL